MIINIKSKNEYLLDILNKNPNTDLGLYLKQLRNGVLAGNALSVHEYEVIFQDTKYSYAGDITNQLDFCSHSFPGVILNAGTELFSHLFKSPDQVIPWLKKTIGEVDNEECTITVPTLYINSSWVRDGEFLLGRYIRGITLSHKVGYNYTLSITRNSVYEAFNLLMLVALFVQLTNKWGPYTYKQDDFVEKYVKILTNICGVPYFIFYLFAKRCIKSDTQFSRFKEIFEEYLKPLNVKLKFDSLYDERKKFVHKQLGNDLTVVDVGCGELNYYKYFRNRRFEKDYWAVDTEESVKLDVEKWGMSNLHYADSISSCQLTERVNVIVSEVLEHNEEEDAIALLNSVLELNFNKIVITVPNRAFNKYYLLEGFRHDDHKWEPTKSEFYDFLINKVKIVRPGYGIDLNIGLGDFINGESPTLACVITNVSTTLTN